MPDTMGCGSQMDPTDIGGAVQRSPLTTTSFLTWNYSRKPGNTFDELGFS